MTALLDFPHYQHQARREARLSLRWTHHMEPEHDLNARLDAARDRLDESVRLLNWSLDLRELLWWGLDLDEMRAEVAAFRRAVETHRRGQI